jgi:hypothetical protein
MNRFASLLLRGCSLSALAWSNGGCQAARAKEPAGARSGPDWPVPRGWQHETFALPPAFAPELPYRGTEEVRFMPGFYTAGAADFWSYDLVWWLPQPPAFDAAAVSTALTAYFRGLATQVGGAKYHFDPARFRTVLTPVPGAAASRLTGQVFTYDPFTTGRPITLNVEAELRRCPSAGHTAIVAALSPKPPTDSVWTHLRTAAGALVCH